MIPARPIILGKQRGYGYMYVCTKPCISKNHFFSGNGMYLDVSSFPTIISKKRSFLKRKAVRAVSPSILILYQMNKQTTTMEQEHVQVVSFIYSFAAVISFLSLSPQCHSALTTSPSYIHQIINSTRQRCQHCVPLSLRRPKIYTMSLSAPTI